MKIEKSRQFKEFFDFVDSDREINFLVLHHVEADSATHAIEKFVEHKVSSHFLIDEAGVIFNLVEENNIAYHAGFSFWKGCDGLNKNSIGIEFINASAFSKKFTMAQMRAGVELCRYLVAKYNIEMGNVVGHSDIAYYPSDKKLDRKQDPSHMFDWKFFAENNIGIYPKKTLPESMDKALFKLGDQYAHIESIKKDLAKFGYRVSNFNNEFDSEMQALVRVFHRRFNQGKFNSDPDVWYLSSQVALDSL